MENISSGILEIVQKGYGFLRSPANSLRIAPTDPYVSQRLVSSMRLRTGMEITGTGKALANQPNISLEKIETIDGLPAQPPWVRVPFHKLTAIDPDDQLILETGSKPLSTRIIDMFTPIGRGQRMLIVAPPRSGKTTIIEEISKGIKENHPEVHLIIFLVDERPEESTNFKRTIGGEVITTDFDQPVREHIRVSHLVFERAKCLVEAGKDVVLMIDSLTRMGRAFNRDFDSKGKTMSGGLASGALEFPRKFYGSARNIEGGGSLTIIASILVDTGSRMDELIFQEFKGTGNSEIVLDRLLSDLRIFPAVDFQKSGTRKEEKLLSPAILRKSSMLRRAMLDDRRGEKYRMFLEKFGQAKGNDEFLKTIPDA
ncbi:MAG: transcription termination factor Rho [Nitrospinae bacterium]|nr:transcription termination factor Rho [Nitrospinota bacterium]